MAAGGIENTMPFLCSMSAETLDVGVDTGSPVGPYPPEFPFTGTVDRSYPGTERRRLLQRAYKPPTTAVTTP